MKEGTRRVAQALSQESRSFRAWCVQGKLSRRVLRVHQTQLKNTEVKFRGICGYLFASKKIQCNLN